MKKIALYILMGFCGLDASAAFAQSALPGADAKSIYNSAKDAASAQYKVARVKCDSLAGNPKDVCVAEAKAADKRSKAEAEATYKGTDKARATARKDIASANYDVAKTKCDNLRGNDKDVCVAEAKSAKVAAVEDASAYNKIADVRKEAAEDKRDAEYKVAKEKCEALGGAAKDSCLKQVKIRFNK